MYGRCPNCGYCPHCGRSDYPKAYPVAPMYPKVYPWIYPNGTTAPYVGNPYNPTTGVVSNDNYVVR